MTYQQKQVHEKLLSILPVRTHMKESAYGIENRGGARFNVKKGRPLTVKWKK